MFYFILFYGIWYHIIIIQKEPDIMRSAYWFQTVIEWCSEGKLTATSYSEGIVPSSRQRRRMNRSWDFQFVLTSQVIKLNEK